MAVFSGKDLKKLRDAQHVSAADLAEMISCDSTTIYRYESGKLKPNPDVMFEICEALGSIDSWGDWMRTEFPTSYGRVHPETPRLGFEGTMMRMFAEINDVSQLQQLALKDGADGHIDDPVLRTQLIAECSEALSALQRFINVLIVQEGASNAKM